jgi:two-component system, NarL family, response regulator NreC
MTSTSLHTEEDVVAPYPRRDGRTAVVVADDHPVVRAGLRMLLQAQPELEVVAEAGDVDSAVAATRHHHPGVLVLDLHMRGHTSLPAIPELRAISPETAIVVLTMDKNAAFARAALRAGALGYVLKESADAELVGAVRLAREGRTYLNPELGAKLARGEMQQPNDPLTARETEVLRLIVLGHTNAEIASSLKLSVRTIESHRAHIQEKLGRHSRAELVSYALEAGLLDRHPGDD